MPAAVYLASAALDQVQAAQYALDRHVTSSATGQCLCCGRPGPCAVREESATVFARYRQLPRRTPGATRPELIHARRLAPTRWHRPDPSAGTHAAR